MPSLALQHLILASMHSVYVECGLLVSWNIVLGHFGAEAAIFISLSSALVQDWFIAAE